MNRELDVIHCAFSTDENYAQHCAAAIASVLIADPDQYFHVHLIQDALSKRMIDRIISTVRMYANGYISVYSLTSRNIGHFRVDDHITLAAYYRLFLPSLLPPGIERIIYLDSDLIVRRSLRPLWKLDMAGHPIAAVFDTQARDTLARLDLQPDYPYFNSGVLVIDLNVWRARNVLPAFVKFIELNHARLRYHDQDVLNVIFYGDVKYLDLTWNCQARAKPSDLVQGVIGTADWSLSFTNPSVIHFTGNRKPWRYKDHVRFEQEYLYYVSKSAFSDFRQSDRTVAAQIERRGRISCPSLFRIYDAVAWRARQFQRRWSGRKLPETF